MSRPGSQVSSHAPTPKVPYHPKYAVGPQNSQPVQSLAQFPPRYQSWQQQFSIPQGYQEMPYQQEPTSRRSSKTSGRHYTDSPEASSRSPETSISRQNSSRSSVSLEHSEHQKNDSGVSNVGTPQYERNKLRTDNPDDEAISIAAHENAFHSRVPHMMQNQRLHGNPTIHPAMQHHVPAGPSDLLEPSVFLARL